MNVKTLFFALFVFFGVISSVFSATVANAERCANDDDCSVEGESCFFDEAGEHGLCLNPDNLDDEGAQPR